MFTGYLELQDSVEMMSYKTFQNIGSKVFRFVVLTIFYHYRPNLFDS